MNTPVINGLTVLLVSGLLVLPPASAADDAEVEYKADDSPSRVEVENRRIEGEGGRPDILIRRETRIYDRRSQDGRDTEAIAPDVYGYRPPAEESYRPPAASVYRPPVQRSTSMRTDDVWYGDRYTDDWMYSLKEFNLADDYRLLSRLRDQPAQPAQPAPPADVFGYVGPDEDVAEVYEPPPEPQPAIAAPELRSVTGSIRELRMVTINGVARVLAVVETDERLARRVLLGSVDEARRLGLDLGMRITAIGEPNLLDDNPVLFATRLEVPEQPTAQRQTRGNWYHGTILNTRTLTRLSDSRRVLLASVLMDDGSTMPIDLGPLEALPRAEIRPNDRITVVGRIQRIRGEPVLVADLLQLRTEMMRVGR